MQAHFHLLLKIAHTENRTLIVGGGHAATLAGRPELPVVNSSNRPLEDYAVSSPSADSALAPLAADAEHVYVPALLAPETVQLLLSYFVTVDPRLSGLRRAICALIRPESACSE